MVRYRFLTLCSLKRSTRGARRFFRDDLRRVEKKGFPDASFVLELFGRLPFYTHIEKPGEKARLAAIETPRSLTALSPSRSDICGVIIPGQPMCNWAQKGRVNGLGKIHSHTPYLVPKLISSSWFPNDSDHRSSFENSPVNRRVAKRETLPQEIPIQTWALYRFRSLWPPNDASRPEISGCSAPKCTFSQ